MIEFTDRYDALGILPTPWTACKGRCAAVGIYPMPFDIWTTTVPRLTIVPQLSDDLSVWDGFPPEDGTVWVSCPECHGTGRRFGGLLGYYLDVLHSYYQPLSWLWKRVRVRWDNETVFEAMKDTPRMVSAMWRTNKRHRGALRLAKKAGRLW
ncbi:MAG: hypothetical protein M3P49_02150 [Actinomycetota bacterium]|nr:hypothetical protein [Actinomycetota bacterium]